VIIGIQREVAKIVLAAAEPYGFALGGGSALIEQGIINRATQDIDSFTSNLDADSFSSACIAVTDELRNAGYEVDIKLSETWRSKMIVTDATNEESTELELSYYHREKQPVNVEDLGLVLDTHDLVAGKMIAFWERATPRDYLDVDSILLNTDYTAPELFNLLKSGRPEATMEEFSSLLTTADRWNRHYITYGLSKEEIVALATRLTEQANNLNQQV